MNSEQIYLVKSDVFDFNLLRNVLSTTDVDHKLLVGEKFRTFICKLWVKNALVNRIYYSSPLLVKLNTSTEYLTIVCFNRKTAQPFWMNGRFIHQDSIQIITEGQNVVFRNSPESEWMTFKINRNELQNFAMEAIGRQLEIPEQGVFSYKLRHESVHNWHKTIQNVFLKINPSSNKKQISAVDSEEISHLLTSNLVKTLEPISPACEEMNEPAVIHKFVQIRNILKHLDANVSSHFSIKDYVEITNLKQRSLEYLVKEAFDASLREFFHATRLNFLHRDFLSVANGTEESISEIMQKWGIVNLGRFANKYKRLFGELPRDTVRRYRNK